ncbi:MAG: DNA polymerase IV [Magnetococcales bacterium]|nr:DNA polymerase IV [Magnetococcales bacterium]
MIANRKIVHIDMDAFYASVEQRDFPEFKGKPLVVGGKSDRGVVAAASYEARKFGIRSAMAMKKALQRCPNIIVVKPRMDVYKEVSQQIREIFHQYTDLVEPLSLDEAYLDVTINKKGIKSASIVAKEIRALIKEQTSLTASAGVSINKFLAKVASDINKPDGLTLIAPEQADAFIAGLPIEKFFGVGKVTAGKMHSYGIKTGADLLQWKRESLIEKFGKVGGFYYSIVRNEDVRAVNPNRERHSVGTEDTFTNDLHDRKEMQERLVIIANKVMQRIEKSQFSGKTVTLKIKFANFRQITRSRTLDHCVQDVTDIIKWGNYLFAPVNIPPQGVRLLGLTVSNSTSEKETGGRQLILPFFAEEEERKTLCQVYDL